MMHTEGTQKTAEDRKEIERIIKNLQSKIKDDTKKRQSTKDVDERIRLENDIMTNTKILRRFRRSRFDATTLQ